METPLRFNVVYLEEAINFITSLDEKVMAKIAYNIFVSQHENNAELFKKLNSGQITKEWLIVCLLFGTRKVAQWS